jgi:hypothetical protein
MPRSAIASRKPVERQSSQRSVEITGISSSAQALMHTDKMATYRDIWPRVSIYETSDQDLFLDFGNLSFEIIAKPLIILTDLLIPTLEAAYGNGDTILSSEQARHLCVIVDFLRAACYSASAEAILNKYHEKPSLQPCLDKSLIKVRNPSYRQYSVSSDKLWFKDQDWTFSSHLGSVSGKLLQSIDISGKQSPYISAFNMELSPADGLYVRDFSVTFLTQILSETSLRIYQHPKDQIFYFQDAMHRVFLIALRLFTSWDVFNAFLKIQFRESRKILKKEYVLRDRATGREINSSKPWDGLLLPGQWVDMVMVFKEFGG